MRARRHHAPTIRRYWDIDSIIARARTLAIHRYSLKVNYQSSFLRSITQNARILIGGVKPHRVKHMIFSHGVGKIGSNIFTYILFPSLPISGKQSAHLTETQRAT